jgi:Tfp pilus assembly protein PilX
VFENRSTGNDLRAKLVNEVAEAGLAQGFEYLMRQQSAMMKTPACGSAVAPPKWRTRAAR